MAKKKHRPPAGRDGNSRFVLLPHYLLRSAAWLTLLPNAKAVLLHIWTRHNGANNDSIVYCVRDAEEICLSKDQASRALKQLIERGFLKVRGESNFDLKTKTARTWELTAEPCGGRAASKDFMRWSPSEISETRSRQRDRQSHQRDRGPDGEIIFPTSVASARPSSPDRASARSRQRDTSNIPGAVDEMGLMLSPEAGTASPAPADRASDRTVINNPPPANSAGEPVETPAGSSAPMRSSSDQLDIEDYLGTARPDERPASTRVHGITNVRLSASRETTGQPAAAVGIVRKISARAS